MSHSYAGSSSEQEEVLLPRRAISLAIEESSQVGDARRAALSMTDALEFTESEQGNLAIIVTEVANNIVRHAGVGELLLRVVEEQGVYGIEILAVDKGPGMANIAQCMQDGYSTAGTMGAGLGAIQRLSSSLTIYSQPGAGTVLLSYLWHNPGKRELMVSVGVVNRPKPREEVCGDSWVATQTPHRLCLMVADGLGHGPDAAKASQAAVRTFQQCSHQRPETILQRIHTDLKATRGAAVAVVEAYPEEQTVHFSGIGNIAGLLLQGDSSQSMVSHYGIVGYQVRKTQEFTYACPPGTTLIVSSDGIATMGKLTSYAGLLSQPPAIIAGVLYRDFQRTSDDTTIVVVAFPGTDSTEGKQDK